MMRLCDHLAARDVKATNLALLEAGNYEGRSGSAPLHSTQDIRKAISAVRTADLDQAIRSILPFEALEPDMRKAWSHWMALIGGRHFFPDANHRTAALTFSLAMSRALGLACFLAPERIPVMVAESKAWRRTAPRPTVAELQGEGHAYRGIFVRYSVGLRFIPL